MQIKSIIKRCCHHMDLDVSDECFSNQTEMNKMLEEGQPINLLLKAVNSVIREISAEYFPELRTMDVDSVTGEVAVDSLGNVGEILYAVDKNGLKHTTRYCNGNVILPFGGRFTLTYIYKPSTDLGIDDNYTCANFNLTEDVVAYGALTEYCLYKEDYENMTIWDKRYKDGIQSLARTRRAIQLPTRRWLR